MRYEVLNNKNKNKIHLRNAISPYKLYKHSRIVVQSENTISF